MNSKHQRRVQQALQMTDELTASLIRQVRSEGGPLMAARIAAIQDDAQRAKEALRAAAIDWMDAEPATIGTVRRPQYDYKVVRVRASFGALEPAQRVEMPPDQATMIDRLGTKESDLNGDLRVLGLMSKVVLIDGGGGILKPAPVIDRQLVEQLQEEAYRVALWEVLLFVFPAGASGEHDTEGSSPRLSKYQFILMDARPLTSPVQVAGSTTGHIDHARELFANRGDVVQHMVALIEKRLGILKAAENPLLREALMCVVLSNATVFPRGHMIIIGPPGIGKSFVQRAHALLAPIYHSVEATKFTEAGLIGDARSSAQIRRPGLAPLAHLGSFGVEDVHQMNTVKNGLFTAVMSQVMQNGKVSDGSVSRTTYAAEVALVLDSNRLSDVRRTGGAEGGLAQLVRDTKLPVNLLSRACYLVEWSRDPVLQFETAIAKLESPGPDDSRDLIYELDRLKDWLADVRERHQDVSIPGEVAGHLKDCFREILNTSVATADEHPDLADFINRGAEQFKEMVRAYARVHDRSIAMVGDVDAVYPILWRKFDFLKSVLTGGHHRDADRRATQPGRARMIRLAVKNLGLQRLRLKDVQKALKITSITPAALREEMEELYGSADDQGYFDVA